MNDEDYNKIVKNIEKETKYKLIKGILYYIKNDKEFRVIRRYELNALMYMMHDNPLSGHFGVKATYDRIKERYYWKGMLKGVEIYVKSCNNCQRCGKP
jgi:hypothetical protein